MKLQIIHSAQLATTNFMVVGACGVGGNCMKND